MAKVEVIEFGILFSDVETAKEYLEDLNGPDRLEVLDDLLKEHDLTITVDREVWRSVDRHSEDKCTLRVRWDKPEVSGDTLENLADTEPNEWSSAAREVANANENFTAYLDVDPVAPDTVV